MAVRSVAAVLVTCAGIAWPGAAGAQSADEFFRGKSMRFTVVYEPGGTYDLYSRLVIAHLPKHIPGNPTIAVQYMPGAGGMVGTLSLHDKAPQDGTQLGMLPRDIAINQMLHPQEARYDARRFNWIGRVASYTGVMFVTSRTGVKTAEDLRRTEVVVGAWGVTTDSFITPTLLNALADTKFKILFFLGDIADPAQVERAQKLAETLGRPESFLNRYGGSTSDSASWRRMFDLLSICATKKEVVNFLNVPELLRPHWTGSVFLRPLKMLDH